MKPPEEQKKHFLIAGFANTLLVIFWMMNTIIWGQFLTVLEITVSLLCAACAYGIWKRARWGYFMAAALAFGLMRLAMDKYSGVYAEGFKTIARGIYLLVIPWAVWLHEVFAKKLV